MSYTAATDPMRFGWQKKQHIADPNDPGAGTLLDGLAYPSATGITAEATNVAEEAAEGPAPIGSP